MTMNETALPTVLRDMGLSQYEVKCYLSLLERDTLTAAEVSRLARIPRPGVYDALEKLTSKGLCTTKPGDTRRYSASDPGVLEEKYMVAVESAVDAELRDLKEREKQLRERARRQKEDISKAIAELKPRYQNSREETSPLDYIEIIKDPLQIHKRFLHLVAGAKEEILVFTKAPFAASPEKSQEQLAQETDILKRGVKARSIYEIEESDRGWLFEHLKRAAKAGEEARVIKELPMKMAIFDSRIVLYVLEDPVSKQTSLTTQIVEHRALAKTLMVVFETFWEKAKDYRILKDQGR